jgi:hypothetical protein
MNTRAYAIGLLSLSALVLFVANFMPVHHAQAMTAIKDRDYQLVTAPIVAGGEALYVTDNRTGMMAVFTWDVGTRGLRLRDVRPVNVAFE